MKWGEKGVPQDRTIPGTSPLRARGTGHTAQQNVLVHWELRRHVVHIKIHKTGKEKAACSFNIQTSYFRSNNIMSPVCLTDGSPAEGEGISI